MKRYIFRILPWLITAAALFVAFRGVNFSLIGAHISEAKPLWLLLAVALTCSSYLIRSWRWQGLFPEHCISFPDSARVLILGFFMNNILPARAGEFVRAHMGAQVTGQKRTLVLATVASERLVDGLTISLMFLCFAVGLGDDNMSHNLLYVAGLFGIAAIGVVGLLALREPIFRLAERVSQKVDHRASSYTLERFQIFINGLAPLTHRARLPRITFLSIIAWSVELVVYYCVCQAFGVQLGIAYYVLLLVAVNFSSLIPAAPGGLGVIEAVGSAVLMSVGVSQELALTVVMCQHLIQYVVVGIPGALIMLTWRDRLKKIEESEREESIQLASQG